MHCRYRNRMPEAAPVVPAQAAALSSGKDGIVNASVLSDDWNGSDLFRRVTPLWSVLSAYSTLSV